jgi:hypothetical protein
MLYGKQRRARGGLAAPRRTNRPARAQPGDREGIAGGGSLESASRPGPVLSQPGDHPTAAARQRFGCRRPVEDNVMLRTQEPTSERRRSPAPAHRSVEPPASRAHHARGAGGAAAGVPMFLHGAAAAALHNSPPTSGPGSRAEPRVHGRGAVLRVAAMSIDAYYRSPVNATNPVIVWTDGARLFFSPSEGQVTSGRASAATEVAFAPLDGYVAEEIQWDRVAGTTTGGGAMIVIARRAGAPDLEVAITNHLEQRTTSAALGVSGGNAQVAPEGAQFVRADDATVPLEFSGAATSGDIHAVTFADGFFRYRAPGGDHDLYVAQGADPVAHLVERATGKIARTFAAGTIAAVVADPNGVVSLERTRTVRGVATSTTTRIDLRTSPPTIATASGHTSAEAGYADAKSRLQALGVTITEIGLRMRVGELETIEQALALGGNRGLNALIELRTREGRGAGDPILEVTKKIGPEAAFGMTGAGTPTLDIFEPFTDTPTDRAATVRHEMTHVIMGAIEAVHRASLTSRERADLEGALRYEAGRAQAKARAGLLRASEYGAGDVVPPAGTRADWRSSVEGDLELANIWVELLRRYAFTSDPEGTGERRGASLADESRYSGASESTGHPADSLGEFVASFVTCATLFRTPFVADVLAAETAGNARGGGGGSYLRALYRSAWNRIDVRYVPLGANPF